MLQKKNFFNKWTIFLLIILSGCTVTASPFVRQMVDLRSIREGMSSQEVKTLLRDRVATGYDLTDPKKSSAPATNFFRVKETLVSPATDSTLDSCRRTSTPIVLRNPYREETIKTENRIYEIAYYFTSIKKQDGMITNDELTPLVFENNRLIGWGWGFWDRLRKEQHL